jgi:hypothetical protein
MPRRTFPSASEPEFDASEFDEATTSVTERRRLTPEQQRQIQVADTLEALLGKKPPDDDGAPEGPGAPDGGRAPKDA